MKEFNEKEYKVKWAKENMARIPLDVKQELKKEFYEIAYQNNEQPATLLKAFIQSYIDNHKNQNPS